MKDAKLKPYLLCLFTYFCVGSTVLTANTIMKPIKLENGWSDSQGAMLITCLSIGFLLMSLAGSLIMKKIGRRRMLFLGGGIIAGCFTLMVLCSQPALFFPIMFVAGFSWGGLNTVVSTVVT